MSTATMTPAETSWTQTGSPPVRCHPGRRCEGKSFRPPGWGSGRTCSRSGADAASAPDALRFESAGTWKTPGSTRVVFSNPSGELDPATPTIQESNRRFRDEEFLLPEQLTRGRSKLRVRLVFVPSAKPLLPSGTPEYRSIA